MSTALGILPPPARSTGAERDALRAQVEETARGVARYVIARSRPGRRDALWPADVSVYLTNPLSLAYGACGTALFLQQALGEVPEETTRWLLEQPLSLDAYPPGLYVGLSGIAFAFERLGHPERAERAMDLAYASPLLFERPGVFDGVAGWGLASLYLHRRSGEVRFMDAAVAAGHHLLSTSETDPVGRYWRTPGESDVALGYAYGGSGIADFLLELYRATGGDRFLRAGLEALEFEIAQAQSEGRRVRWGPTPGTTGTTPYWLRGTAGIGRVLVRFHRALGGDRFLDLAERAAGGVEGLFAVLPGQFEGMSGIGEFLLDLHAATGDARYAEAAEERARSILCYRVERPEGYAFPGRYLTRICLDYGTGAAGVGSFLLRLLSPARPSPFDIVAAS